jgi:hypothetical protein
MSRAIFIAAALALAVSLPAVPANAQSPRTFVSAAGTDNPTCSFAAPCRHFQAAVTATSAGGEVDALDPAGYGPINIDRAITIEGQGWSYIAPPTGGNGITINAVSGSVFIHGVSLNGAGISGGTNGIVFNSGGSLTVTDCVVQNFAGTVFTGNGIFVQPTSGTIKFAITNTIVADNGSNGIILFPPTGSGTVNVNGVIDHVVVTENGSDGMNFQVVHPTGGSVVVDISNSVTSNNAARGIEGGTGTNTVTLSIDSTIMISNVFSGAGMFGKVQAFLGRSVMIGNGVPVENNTSTDTFFSYKNNQFDVNVGTLLNTTLGLQ